MVFGGSPNPAGFSCFSEMLTDLSNELGMSDYSPEMGRSPTVDDSYSVVRETEEPGSEIAEACLPALEVGTRSDSYRDCFIDDIIDCHLDTTANRARAAHLVQMAVHVMSRPHAGDKYEPVPRRPLLGPDKLAAEGRSSERQIVLGWEIRTREFKVSLPADKHRAWKDNLEKIIATGMASREETESLIGRLNHASYVIPLSRHFLNEIRRKCLGAPEAKKRQSIRFSLEEIQDLKLWVDFLDVARAGMSINTLVVRTPTRIAWSDSCPFGLGGYTLSGTAWRIKVPPSCPFYGEDSVNNVLKFLGMAISVLLLIEEITLASEKFPCLLVLGDNTSAISWIFKSGRVAGQDDSQEGGGDSPQSRGPALLPASGWSHKYRCGHTEFRGELQIENRAPNQRLPAKQCTNDAPSHLPFTAHSAWFQNSPVARRDRIISLVRDANNCEVMDAKGEGSHERGDRYWRRWIRFLEEWGVDRDPLLDSISQEPERLLLVRGFVLHHRTFDFDPQGVATKERERPMVSSTIRDAISSVASAFRQRGRASPFHLPNRVN